MATATGGSCLRTMVRGDPDGAGLCVSAWEDPPSRQYAPRLPEPADQAGPEPWFMREHTTWAPAMHETMDPAGTELRRLSGLEEGPPPGAKESTPGGEFAELYHGITGDRRRYTQAYRVGAAAARVAVEEDEAARGSGDWSAPSDDVVTPFGPTFDISPVTVMFAASDAGLEAPKSVSAAKRLRDDRAPFGWEQAILKEVRRVEGFGAWHIVPMSQYWAENREYPGRVSIG